MFKAMENEFQALLKNNTWTLVSPTPTQKVIGSKWVYHLKLLPNGSVAKHKARLMAKGFLQTLALDYFHTVNLVVKPTTIRGFIDPSKPNHVRKLNKCLYGLKQSPQA
ncbi:Retrovirus-related Pol polyprotein from transposon RE1 [Vitis vinifera]|uniref:Retrovirus-related Pol polyprotein from transposon RE1 n=1 Tax=Vitis vinifera TaxID=29760 RepID=A0A438BU25_VITVI|nr:Retrovirus-related Pol polyprotein from transposon RE1 [Vitis vinifera]